MAKKPRRGRRVSAHREAVRRATGPDGTLFLAKPFTAAALLQALHDVLAPTRT